MITSYYFFVNAMKFNIDFYSVSKNIFTFGVIILRLIKLYLFFNYFSQKVKYQITNNNCNLSIVVNHYN